MTKPNTSCTIEVPASLRSDGVRDHPGMPFGFIPDLAFGFAGIPTSAAELRFAPNLINNAGFEVFIGAEGTGDYVRVAVLIATSKSNRL